MKEPEIDIEEDSTDIEVIEIDSDTIDGAAADSDAAPNIQNVSEENEPPVQPDNEIENTDRLMRAAAKQLEFEKAAALRDHLGVLRQQWANMHEAADSKLKKPARDKVKRRRTGTKL